MLFGTSWPLILSGLPGGIHLVRLLFVFLILLGVDSAFSFQEAVITCLRDTGSFREVAKWKIALVLTLSCWLIGFLYATDAGLFFLDVTDFYINFVMLFIGFIETFAVGWIYGIEDQIAKHGIGAVFAYMFANFGSVLIACGFWFGVNVWSGFVALLIVYGVFVGITVSFLSKNKGSITEDPLGAKMMDLAFGNIFDFQTKAEPIIKYVPTIWCFLIKQFIPQVLLFLFVNLAQSKTKTGQSKFGHYEGYPFAPYQVRETYVLICFNRTFCSSSISLALLLPIGSRRFLAFYHSHSQLSFSLELFSFQICMSCLTHVKNLMIMRKSHPSLSKMPKNQRHSFFMIIHF